MDFGGERNERRPNRSELGTHIAMLLKEQGLRVFGLSGGRWDVQALGDTQCNKGGALEYVNIIHAPAVSLSARPIVNVFTTWNLHGIHVRHLVNMVFPDCRSEALEHATLVGSQSAEVKALTTAVPVMGDLKEAEIRVLGALRWALRVRLDDATVHALGEGLPPPVEPGSVGLSLIDDIEMCVEQGRQLMR